MKLLSRYFFILIFGFWILGPGFAQASPRKGFYEGPYITLSGGIMQLDWDVNQRTKTQEGNSFEPIVALGFGWNVYDWLAPELSFHYTNNPNNGRREHVAAANIGLAFTWLAKPLLDFEKWRILPFIKPGFSFQVSSLPGDTLAPDKRVTVKGYGPSLGGGVRFTFKEYLYLGVEVQEEFLNQKAKFQLLTPGGATLIYDSGWQSQFAAFTMVGVHF